MNFPAVDRSQVVQMTTTLRDVETPRAVLDGPKLERNLAAMQARADALGVVLRPHLKTAKSVEVALKALDPRTGRITVSTLKEAEFFGEAGFRDVLYSVGIAPNKLAHAAALRRDGMDLTVIVDNLEAIRALSSAARANGWTFSVMVEVDTDGHRAGVRPDDPALIEIARIASTSPGVKLRGVMTHAGGSYDCRSLAEIADVAEAERAGAVQAARRIREAGFEVQEVSVGSTPTLAMARSLEGVTEARAGVYMFQDLVMAGLGVCSPEDIALSVLTSVIGHQADRGWVMVDAGWMALSRDRGTAGQRVDQGYGLVCDEAGRVIDDIIVLSVNQEHGVLGRRNGPPLRPEDFPVGALLRILPNHACATAAQHQSFLLVDGPEGFVRAEWRRINGW